MASANAKPRHLEGEGMVMMPDPVHIEQVVNCLRTKLSAVGLRFLDWLLDGRHRRWLEGKRLALDPWGTYVYSTYLDATQDTGIHETNETRRLGVPRSEANLIASPIPDDPEGRHILILDVDHPVRAIPSSSKGKWHLYIQHPTTWDALAYGSGQWSTPLLGALSQAGVIHPNYLAHSLERRYTNVRLPWVRKLANARPSDASVDDDEERS